MNKQVRQYLFAAIFVAVGVYEATQHDWLEFWLYAVAGSAFAVNALTMEPRLATIKRPLVFLTWALIVAAALLFFYVIQFRF